PQPSLKATASAPSNGLAFASLAQAEASMLTRHLDKDWRSPINDATMPRNDQDRALHVANLLAAMKDTSACTDKPEPAAFKNRWGPAATRKPNASQMEKVCWKLVDIAERLHKHGPASLSIYDAEALQTVWKSRALTFGERMASLGALLRLSKARCFSLLKGEVLETTVGAPAQKVAGTKTNFCQNGRRKVIMDAGR
ncbi:hypothetical protein BDW02DRAFT_473501, partial [Decorospora gaudefroyi]